MLYFILWYVISLELKVKYIIYGRCWNEKSLFGTILATTYAFAFVHALCRSKLSGLSPPPRRTACSISRIHFVNTLARLLSFAAFLCLILLHFECPAKFLLVRKTLGRVTRKGEKFKKSLIYRSIDNKKRLDCQDLAFR